MAIEIRKSDEGVEAIKAGIVETIQTLLTNEPTELLQQKSVEILYHLANYQTGITKILAEGKTLFKILADLIKQGDDFTRLQIWQCLELISNRPQAQNDFFKAKLQNLAVDRLLTERLYCAEWSLKTLNG